MQPEPSCGQASCFFSEHVLQHGLVQAQVSYQLLQLPVLFLQLFQPAYLRHAQAAVLLLPPVKRRLAHTQLPDNFSNRRSLFRLLQGKYDLWFGKSFLHVAPPSMRIYTIILIKGGPTFGVQVTEH